MKAPTLIRAIEQDLAAGHAAVVQIVSTGEALNRLLPGIPAVAALSANHLAALHLPFDLRRLYVARDADREGRRACETLRARAAAAGVPEVWELVPVEDDFNADLLRLGPCGLALHLAPQIAEADAAAHLRFEGEPADLVA